MKGKRIRIVADSSCDISELEGVEFSSAPLKIITSEKEYTDNASLDVEEMVNDLKCYSGKSSTSCPNAGDWLDAFGDAERIFCITITGTISGSYNSAMLAKETYEEMHPERKVFVLNSLTAGPEIKLLLEKLRELCLEEKSFSEICTAMGEYIKTTGLLFVLESMKNLANNGRVSPVIAKMAGLLGIRAIGKASDKGDLEPLEKCRGQKKTLEAVIKHMKKLGVNSGKIRIAHCLNEGAATELAEFIKKEFKKAQIELYKCRGLCSFYAEKGGLLIGFEKA